MTARKQRSPRTEIWLISPTRLPREAQPCSVAGVPRTPLALFVWGVLSCSGGTKCPDPCTQSETLSSTCESGQDCWVDGHPAVAPLQIGCGQTLKVDLALTDSAIVRSGDFVLIVGVDQVGATFDDPTPGLGSPATIGSDTPQQSLQTGYLYPVSLVIEVHVASPSSVSIPFGCRTPSTRRSTVKLSVVPGPCYRAAACGQ